MMLAVLKTPLSMVVGTIVVGMIRSFNVKTVVGGLNWKMSVNTPNIRTGISAGGDSCERLNPLDVQSSLI